MPELLVVDDDPAILRMLQRVLAAAGFTVRAEADGGAALAALERSLPDLLVLDLTMPGLDGLRVAERVRAKGLALPILFPTARERRRRPRRRTRGGRRRLPGEAVRDRRAGRAGAGAAPPHARRRRCSPTATCGWSRPRGAPCGWEIPLTARETALLGVATFGVLISTATRNSAAAVVSTLMLALSMQLVGALPGTEPVRPYLLSDQFVAWHGLLRVPVDWAPIRHALWLCTLYVASPVAAAYLVFLRRDVAGD